MSSLMTISWDKHELLSWHFWSVLIPFTKEQPLNDSINPSMSIWKCHTFVMLHLEKMVPEIWIEHANVSCNLTF